MKRRERKPLVVEEEKAVPMSVEDYERLINLIGENLTYSMKNIQLAIEAAQLTSNDEGFKNALERFMKKAKEIEKDMQKYAPENEKETNEVKEVQKGLDF